MSGRVGHLVREGKLDMLERVRSRQRSWQRLIELTRGFLAGRWAEEMAIRHVAVPEDATQLVALARAGLPCPPNIVVAELTPGLSVHGGAGMVGIVVVAEKGRPS